MITDAALRKRQPLRGEIWFTRMAYDSPETKRERPVVVVSVDARNRHEKATSVLIVPLSTTIHRDHLTHVFLRSGETGLQEDCVAQCENIVTVAKSSLSEPRQGLRTIMNSRICEMADKVKLAMGCLK